MNVINLTVIRGGRVPMSMSTIAKASRVDRAYERLEAAVDRLDLALTSRTINTEPVEGSEVVERLRLENAELKNLNLAAADRLNTTIQRLDSILKNEGDN
jgi:hypothetical protein